MSDTSKNTSYCQASRAHICMLVWNEFLHDARVTKEGETLTQAGYAVTVIAVHNPQLTKTFETVPSGLRIRRVPRSLPRWVHTLLSLPRRAKHKLTRQFTASETNNSSTGGTRQTPQRQHSIFRAMTLVFGRLCGRWRMLQAVFRTNADVYHAHDVNVLPMAWLAAVLRRKPLVYDAHEISLDREGYRRIRWLVWLMERLLAPRAAFTLTTTEMRADVFQKEYGLPRPLVLQNRTRYAELEPNTYLRERFNIESDRPIILYQGGIQPGRGLHNVLRVADQLRGYAFVLVGKGAQLPEITAEADRLDLEGTVFFHPMVKLDELPEITASADIGLQVLRNTCLNHYTTDSNKLFEYIMAGLAVVASDFPELRQILTDYEVGHLVDPESVSDIVRNIRFIVETPGELTRLQANARRARHDLSWERQEHILIDAYAELLQYDR